MFKSGERKKLHPTKWSLEAFKQCILCSQFSLKWAPVPWLAGSPVTNLGLKRLVGGPRLSNLEFAFLVRIFNLEFRPASPASLAGRSAAGPFGTRLLGFPDDIGIPDKILLIQIWTHLLNQFRVCSSSRHKMICLFESRIPIRLLGSLLGIVHAQIPIPLCFLYGFRVWRHKFRYYRDSRNAVVVTQYCKRDAVVL